MRHLLCLLMLCMVLGASAQDDYTTNTNIPYYPDSIRSKDTYLSGQCVLDLYYPIGKKEFATVVWFHGGGLTGGNKEIPKALLGKGVAIVGVGYRLSPKVQVSQCIEDAAAAVAWVFKNIAKYGGNTRLVFVSGHSAGGYLGMMVTLNKQYLAPYAIDPDSIASLIPFSGQAITHFTRRKEQGIKETQPVIDAYAPLNFVRANAPPMLLITGDRNLELYGRYEENAYLWRMMQLAGHKSTRLLELQGFDHGGMAEPAFPLLLKEVSSITKEKTGQQ